MTTNYDPFNANNQVINPRDNFLLAQEVAQRFLDRSHDFTGALEEAARNLTDVGLPFNVDIQTPAPPPLTPPALIEAGDYLYTPEYGDAPTINDRTLDATMDVVAAPEQNFGDAPTPLAEFTGEAPAMGDTIQTFAAPDSPSITLPSYPDFTSITFPQQLDTEAPEYVPSEFDFHIEAPNIVPFVEPEDTIVAQVITRREWLLDRVQNGGTGLPPPVEQAIWDRERDREVDTMLAAEEQALTQDAASGFPMPAGSVQAKLYKLRMDMSSKLISLGRELAIKQAEMEIANINKTLELLNDVEGKLITADMEKKRIMLEAAKYQTDAAVQIFDAQIKAHMATLEAKKIGVQVYQAMMEGYTARVNAYRTQVEAEVSKVQYNKGLIDMYNAQLNAEGQKVALYKARIDALTALSHLEEFKIRKFEAEIHAYTAEVNAYTARVSGKQAEVGAWAEKVKAYQAQVQAYATQIDANGKKFMYAIESYKALLQADTLRTDIYKTKVQAESVKVDAGAKYASTVVSAQSAYAQAMSSYNSVLSTQWNAVAQQQINAGNLALSAAKMNSDVQLTYRQMSNDMAKTTAQVYAQLSGSAMGMAHASSSETGSFAYAQGVHVNYNYSGQIK